MGMDPKPTPDVVWLSSQCIHYCALQQQNDLALAEGSVESRGLRNGHPSDRKGELPMELTAKLTVVTAIVSFSFLAAVILGMI